MKYTYTFDQLRDCPGENTERLFLSYKTTVGIFGAVDLDGASNTRTQISLTGITV